MFVLKLSGIQKDLLFIKRSADEKELGKNNPIKFEQMGHSEI